MSNHLIDALRQATGATPNAIFAELPGGKTITYSAFFNGAGRMAQVLLQSGVQPGDRVAAQVVKSVEALQLYIGTVMAGAVYLPLNTGYQATELQHFVTDAEPAVFVCDPAQTTGIKALTQARVLTLDADGTGSLTDAAAGCSDTCKPVQRTANDLAAILYTSGTTGKPKGAMLSHGNLLSNSLVLRDLWRFTRDDVLIHALPVFHTHGLFVATNVTLLAGGRALFFPSFDTDAVLAAMPRATVMMGVPTFYTRLLGCAGLAEAAQTMRLFISGSAPLLAETHQEWERVTGHAILERYGMTETNMNTSNPYNGARRAGTVGFPLPGVDLRLTDGKGVDVPQGAPGIVEVRGPNVFQGYWNLPEKTAEELLPDGFFVTGDIGKIDGDGYLHIIGRAKDMIITGGYNVYPKEVELLIDQVPGVLESAVIGVPHPDFGEGVLAVVVPKTGAEVSEADVLAALDGGLARYKQPKAVAMRESLPRNTMGKVQKNLLREMFDGAFSPG